MRILLGLISILFFHVHSLAMEPIIILMGPPGCGKGNFSDFCKERYGYNHLGAGDLVRQEIELKTEIGKEIDEVVKAGKYIDVAIMHKLMRKAIKEFRDAKKPFIIDGYGGNDPEAAKFLHTLLSEHNLLDNCFVLFLEVSDAVCCERMGTRLYCKECKRNYNTISIKPRVKGHCDLCQGPLSQRVHETTEMIKNRLALYRSCAEPKFMKTVDYFPVIFYKAENSVEQCSKFYDELLGFCEKFEGDSLGFVESHQKWLKDNCFKVSLPKSNYD